MSKDYSHFVQSLCLNETSRRESVFFTSLVPTFKP